MRRPNRSNFNLKDKRTYQARRFHTLRESFAEQLPRNLSAAQDALLTQAVTFALLAEQETAKIVASDSDADPGKFTHYSNRYIVLLARLGGEPVKLQLASEAGETSSDSAMEPGDLIAAILAP